MLENQGDLYLLLLFSSVISASVFSFSWLMTTAYLDFARPTTVKLCSVNITFAQIAC